VASQHERLYVLMSAEWVIPAPLTISGRELRHYTANPTKWIALKVCRLSGFDPWRTNSRHRPPLPLAIVSFRVIEFARSCQSQLGRQVN
jgi:hypothetical protein